MATNSRSFGFIVKLNNEEYLSFLQRHGSSSTGNEGSGRSSSQNKDTYENEKQQTDQVGSSFL